MNGYVNNPEANAASFLPGGWFKTGDLGRLDKGGQVPGGVAVRLLCLYHHVLVCYCMHSGEQHARGSCCPALLLPPPFAALRAQHLVRHLVRHLVNSL